MSRGKKNPTELADAHLVRFGKGRSKGWQVRLPMWHPLSQSREYTEFYADGLYDGEQQAKQVARARRDALFVQAGLPLRLRATTLRTNNTTGLVGVNLCFDASAKGLAAFSWLAFWVDEDGTRRTKRFKVRIHGFEEALRQAVELRERNTDLLFTEEQLLHALSLRDEVDYYVHTGRRATRKPPRPTRTQPSTPASPRSSNAALLAHA